MNILDLPKEFNAATYFVDRHLEEGRGDKIAVLCEDKKLTYRDIQNGVNRLGNLLKSLGVRNEERVALLLHDTEVYPQAFFGAIKIGSVPVCMNTLLRPKDYAYQLNDSRARVLLVEAALLPLINEIKASLAFLEKVVVVNGEAGTGQYSFDELIKESDERLSAFPTHRDEPCFWLYSSGSTGDPKGTVHLHHDMVFAVNTFAKQILGLKEDDVCFSAAKLFFAYGLGNGLYFPFGVGATAVYMPARPTAESVYKTIEKHRPSIYFGVPTLYGYMLESKGAIDSVRLCVSAGEALPADILMRWKTHFGVEIIDGIGSTEMSHIFIANRPGEIRPGSTGKVVPGYEAKIVDENMNEVDDGEVGTLLVKGDSSAACYWNQHEKTKKTMVGEWLNTGDKFYRDNEGFFYYAGRTDDMLKVGGIWVSPVEVEASLISHPAILECAVVSATDEENLVKPKAYVVLKEGFKQSEQLDRDIKDHVKKALAHYKYPRWIVFVNDLPKTATGKIKRFELRNLDGDNAAVA